MSVCLHSLSPICADFDAVSMVLKMNRKIRKSLSLLLVFVLMLALIPTTTFAYEAEGESGTLIDVIQDVDEGSATSNANEATARASRAIVILPGIIGSSLKNYRTNQDVWLNVFNYSQMALNEDGTGKYPDVDSVDHDHFGAGDTYKSLYNGLNTAFGSNFTVIFFDYDWRMDISSAATKLENELANYSEVVLVAHSMGGLVASKFLDNKTANRSKTLALITLSTPYVGSAKCINVMETGELLSFLNIGLFENTVKDVCKNSYAAYEILPTSKYYSTTSQYPISVNGTNYTTSDTQLKKTAWGKKSNGTVKPMFATATSFHSSLYSGSTHIINSSDVTTYTIAVNGESTISRVNLASNYTISSLSYSNAGDGTVLYKSAGLGTPDYLYTGVDHTSMVKSNTIITKVKQLITSVTGVSAANTISEYEVNDDAVEINPDELVLNERGWISGPDNERINFFASGDVSITVNDMAVEEVGERLYVNSEECVGSVWNLGDTGRKQYVLNVADCKIVASGNVRIEYLDSGYYDQILEYTLDDNEAVISIPAYDALPMCQELVQPQSNENAIILPSHVYSSAELDVLNQD